jgi:hypothetical protein
MSHAPRPPPPPPPTSFSTLYMYPVAGQVPEVTDAQKEKDADEERAQLSRVAADTEAREQYVPVHAPFIPHVHPTLHAGLAAEASHTHIPHCKQGHRVRAACIIPVTISAVNR